MAKRMANALPTLVKRAKNSIARALAEDQELADARKIRPHPKVKLTDREKIRIRKHILAGMTRREIRSITGVSLNTLRKMANQLQSAGKLVTEKKQLDPKLEGLVKVAAKAAIHHFKKLEENKLELPRTMEEARLSLGRVFKSHALLKRVVQYKQQHSLLFAVRERKLAPVPIFSDKIPQNKEAAVLASFNRALAKTTSPITDTAIKHKLGIGAVAKLVEKHLRETALA